MLPTDRIAYSAITERPQLKLPDGARMAVWVIVNVEEWDPRAAMPRTVLTPPAGARQCRHSELGLARIRQPRRLLALRRSLRCTLHPGSAGDQRLGACSLSGDRARGARSRLGVHGARLHSTQHAEGGGRARRYSQDARGHRPGYRQAAARLAVPDCGDLGTPDLLVEKATITSPIGCSTISRSGSRPEASRSSTCPTRRNATMSP